MRALGNKLTIGSIHDHEAPVAHQAESIEVNRGHAESAARLNRIKMESRELHRHKKVRWRGRGCAGLGVNRLIFAVIIHEIDLLIFAGREFIWAHAAESVANGKCATNKLKNSGNISTSIGATDAM